MSLAEIALEEAIRLGLVPDDVLKRLEEQGILTSPFIGSGGGQLPYWRLPSMFRTQRGGVFQPRFGLGPLREGLALSPPAPAISGGGVPVGRASQHHNQGPAPLETLLGRGDYAAIARGVQNGTIDLNTLPADVRAQVLQLLQPNRKKAEDEGMSDEQKAAAAAKQVLSLAKQVVGKGPGAQVIDQALGQTSPEGRVALEEQRTGERTPPGAPAVQPQPQGAPTTAGATPTPDPVARLEAMGFTPVQIQQILQDTGGGTGTGNVMGLEGQIPLVGDRPAPVLFQDPSGNFVSDPGIEEAISRGLMDRASVEALVQLGYSPPEIEQILGGQEAVMPGASPAVDATAGASGSNVPGAVLSGLGGLAGIFQAATDDNLTDLQKAFKAAAAAAPAAGGVIGALDAGSGAAAGAGAAAEAGAAAGGAATGAETAMAAVDSIPYLGLITGAATGLANVGLTATGPGSDEYKAAAAAVDLAAGLLAGVTFGISSMVAPSIKAALYKAFYDVPHDVREKIETARTAQTTNQFLNEIQSAKSLPELYQTLRNWQTGLVGGMTGKDTQHGLDPIAYNVYAAPNGGRPEWNYLGLYKDGGVDPNAPTMQEFFQRLQEHPEDFSIGAQAGVGPEDQGVTTNPNQNPKLAAMDRAVLMSIQEQINEINAREQVRPNLPAFSKMAGYFVSEDDVIDALRQGGRTGAQLGTPEFADLLRQAERARVSKAATDEAMANQPYLLRAPREGDPSQYDIMAPDTQQNYLIGEALKQPKNPDHPTPFITVPRGEGSVDYDILSAPSQGYTFRVGEGWFSPAGELAFPTSALTPPSPWVDMPAAQPPSTATPPSSGEVPVPAATGQSAVPPTSPLAPEDPAQQPLGIMHSGGVVPQTGPYILQEGETVIPAQNTTPTPWWPNGLQNWNMDGYILPSTVKPQPTLQNPGLYWIQDEENQWHVVDPRNYPPAPIMPGPDLNGAQESRYYLNPKSGVPYEDKKNPEPGRDWRLVFDPADLHKAWQERAKDGAPLLVPKSVLERPDWPTVVEKARQSQYQTVHPAVLLARSIPMGVLGGRQDDTPALYDIDNLDAIQRFRDHHIPVPIPEATPPMREMPGRRPMSPHEEDQVDEEWSSRAEG